MPLIPDMLEGPVIIKDTMRKRKKSVPIESPPEEVEISDELAWRVHDNAKDWIVQVDVKAAAALAIEAAVLGFAFALITTSGVLAQLTTMSRWVIGVGLVLLFVSVVFSLTVLRPRVKLREPAPQDRGYLYFGHLRHWKKDELSRVLARNTVNDDQLADQVIKMSVIAWRKHLWLKWSLIFLLTGIALIGVLYLALVLGLVPDLIGNLTPPTAKEVTP